ncbi:NEDD8-activating enzyme E1 catalytic subunit-like isoform X6 [Salvelinus alpinus]|uniref:NEDD8-activating enzyme E1 catalytic subunit-like isoform X6 n=1 Tax=Salvelinus alpinus TaxID=8036 RepID=UPI0039FD080A
MADAEEPEKKRRKIEELTEKMAVDGDSRDWDGRWNHVKKFLERPGPFTHPDFEPSIESLGFLLETCKILVIGAGGLGCELLKNLALSGFRHIHVVDMDTIDISNLNRQFLFRTKDVGRPKADVAADFINGRVPGCQVVPHFNKIQDFDESFYRQFHIIVCGLDSIIARRWMNGMLISLLSYEDGVLDPSSIIPLIDGGTEGFKGNARVILPGMTACIDCTLELYPPQIHFPMCTIASMPRLPEHCVEYVRMLQWPKDKPFGVTVLSHRCNSRTDSGEAKAESRASSETQPSLLTQCTINPEASRTNVLEETPYTWRLCQRALRLTRHRSRYCTMGQGHPCRPNTPLTRTMLGQLCAAPWVSRSRPAATVMAGWTRTQNL